MNALPQNALSLSIFNFFLCLLFIFRGLKVIVGVHPGPSQLMIVKEPPQIYEENNIYHDIMLLKLPKRAVRPTIGIPPLGCTRPAV